jgi:hypothetical protein
MSSALHFFNTQVCLSGERSRLNGIANLCFTPVRHCFGGRFVDVMGERVHLEYALPLQTRQSPEKNYIKTAIMVALLIPGLILGTVARLISLRSADVRAACTYTPVTQPHTWLKPEQTDLETLKQRQAETKKQFWDLIGKLKTVNDVWGNPDFLSQLNTFFDTSFETMDHLLANAERETKSPDKLAVLLMRNVGPTSGNFNYVHSFLFDGFIEMYHIARQQLVVTAIDVRKIGFRMAGEFGLINQRDYFSPLTAKNSHREKFNQICQRLDTLGIHQKLNDDPIYKARTMPDHAPFARSVKIGPPITKD